MRRLPAVLATALVACGGAPDGPPLAVPRLDTVGAVVRVVNTGPSAWADGEGWRFVLDREIVPPDDGDGSLARPTGVVATSAGEIVVMDEAPVALQVYGPDGTWRRRIGRDGGGPGEFAAGAELLIHHDTLVVHDRRQRRLVLFLPDGTYLRTVEGAGGPARGITTDGRLATMTYLDVAAERPGEGVIRRDLDGATRDTLPFPPEPLPRMWTLVDASHDLGASIPLTPERATRLDRQGGLVWGDQAHYRLIVSRHGLDTARIIEAPATPLPIPDSLRRDALETATRELVWLKPIATLADIPVTWPAWTTFHLTDDDHLWVLRPGPRGAADTWDVFRADGALLGRVPALFPPAPGKRLHWTTERVYQVAENGDGVPMIQVWRIDRTLR